jgi:alkylated DNA repair dioxygenase AlkB
VDLAHGDLLLMYHLQHDHEHALPRRLRVQTPRINFTFRHIRTS